MRRKSATQAKAEARLVAKLQKESLKAQDYRLDSPKKAPVKKRADSYMDMGDVIAIIQRRRAKFQAQSRSSPRLDVDETAVVIVGEYDALLAEIEQALASSPRRNAKTKKLRPKS